MKAQIAAQEKGVLLAFLFPAFGGLGEGFKILSHSDQAIENKSSDTHPIRVGGIAWIESRRLGGQSHNQVVRRGRSVSRTGIQNQQAHEQDEVHGRSCSTSFSQCYTGLLVNTIRGIR